MSLLQHTNMHTYVRKIYTPALLFFLNKRHTKAGFEPGSYVPEAYAVSTAPKYITNLYRTFIEAFWPPFVNSVRVELLFRPQLMRRTATRKRILRPQLKL
jgi:hypothetical protein